MAKKFISVPTKLIMLIVSALLILAIGFSILSLSRLQDDYKQFHQNTLAQAQAQFALHSDILRSKMNVWLESFSEISKFSQQQDFTVFSKQLANQFDGLQLNLNIENIWLVNDKKDVIFETSNLPSYVQRNIDQVLEFQRPNHQISCQQYCVFLLSVPLLNNQGDIIVITMTASLVDMLYAINTSLHSDVAVVSFSSHMDGENQKIKIISASDRELTQTLFQEKEASQIQLLQATGMQIELAERNYLINLLPLAENEKQEFYLSLIDDVTAFEEKSRQYRQQFLLSLIGIFFILGLFLYGLARPFTNRLLRLSAALPLLANKKFDEFRQVKLKRPILFSDELDILTHSAV